jgi:hypothetical protein
MEGEKGGRETGTEIICKCPLSLGPFPGRLAEIRDFRQIVCLADREIKEPILEEEITTTTH